MAVLRGVLASCICIAMMGPAAAFPIFPVADQQDSDPVAAEVSLEAIRILNAEDQHLYARIFEIQEAGDWKAADQLINQLSSDVLMGHVRHQRYMHPTKYRSKYAELKDWLANYADHPDAHRLYRLAKKRQGRAGAPKRPLPVGLRGPAAEIKEEIKPVPRSKDDRKAVAQAEAVIRREIRLRRPERAEKQMWAFERRAIWTDLELAENLGQLATAYFFSGNDEKGLALGVIGAEFAGGELIQPAWIAGMSAWRTGDCVLAARHFREVAKSRAGPWTVASGAFWAARAELACSNPADVPGLLAQAASYPETFYGLIASRQLGLDLDLDWSLPSFTIDDHDSLSEIAGVRRAIALAEIGNVEMADEEMRLVWGRYGEPVRKSLISLATRLNLPATQMRLSRASNEDEPASFSALYPMPEWQPEGGFTMDRAVIYAFMRQESEFRAAARSRVGARGLMQVMPATASYITGDRSLRSRSDSRLYDPAINIKLGQTYMEYLLGQDNTEGNLFMLAAAYNGGPGNLSKWHRTVDFKNDPLLFVETIPLRETRHYVERVMANLWLYRMRMGQPTPSLDATAAGAWPLYEPLDPKIRNVAELNPRRAGP